MSLISGMVSPVEAWSRVERLQRRSACLKEQRGRKLDAEAHGFLLGASLPHQASTLRIGMSSK